MQKQTLLANSATAIGAETIRQILERERTKDRGQSTDIQAAKERAKVSAHEVIHAFKLVEGYLRHTFDAETSRKAVASLAADIAEVLGVKDSAS